MRKYKWAIILLNLLLLLAFVNYSIIKKEAIVSNGKFIFLQLAPVDSRSLMQGDYMALRYTISKNIHIDSIPKRGYCVVQLDSNQVAQKLRLQKSTFPLGDKQYLIEYTSGIRGINIGAESYFFQQGKTDRYLKAKYGGIKIDQEGNSLLVGLYDEHFKKIE